MSDYFNASTDEHAYEWEVLERYDEWLDEIHGTVTVAMHEYDTSRALKELDPIAYRGGFNDWLDSEGWDESDDDTDLEPEDIPEDHPVRPLDDTANAADPATCGTCGLSWDDGISTSMTPTPGARCPFEYFHRDEFDGN